MLEGYEVVVRELSEFGRCFGLALDPVRWLCFHMIHPPMLGFLMGCLSKRDQLEVEV